LASNRAFRALASDVSSTRVSGVRGVTVTGSVVITPLTGCAITSSYGGNMWSSVKRKARSRSSLVTTPSSAPFASTTGSALKSCCSSSASVSAIEASGPVRTGSGVIASSTR